MITLNIIKLSELEKRSKRFINVPKPKAEKQANFNKCCNILIESVKTTQNERQVEKCIETFLTSTFYDANQIIPNENKMDFVIKSKQDDINKVIIEAKSQQNKNEFISAKDCNKKSLWELILYFFNEVNKGNNQIKSLITTNGLEFYIFEAKKFYEVFAKGELYKQYTKILSAEYKNNNDDFYNLAKQYIQSSYDTLDCIYFNISDYQKSVSKIFRIFSQPYLLAEITHIDANEINKNFYNELLHIIGLEETKSKGKTKILRKGPEKGRGSLFELALNEIEIYNNNNSENIALQLCILWINRLLFLKLLETQICKYKEQNEKFLTCENIKTFHDLNDLFFKVLGVEQDKRDNEFKTKYPQVPYLNSALFEISEEEKTIHIRALRDNEILPYYSKTCLSQDKKIGNQLTTLQYLLKFLDSYDFGTTTNDDNADDEKIINASILGRIFEKINGYKDGAVFTPSFITMYMCKETLQRAVIDKFNGKYNWQCVNLDELYNKLSDEKYKEYNELINSLTICDPAVGSGHFLVSALNELIRIKSELGLLYYNNRKIKCHIDIKNDDLIISRGGELFKYDYKDKDSQEIQECLFNEKKTLIENCLFGVDINPNSVNICRLRLWIELLKNTYYKPNTNYQQLETLPNIDINIKCGNSLISAIKVEIGQSAIKSKLSNIADIHKIKKIIEEYKNYVQQYKNTNDKKQKINLNRQIEYIKTQIHPPLKPYFEFSEEYRKLNKEEEDKNNIYKNAMEWMIEFPEILDDDGKFCGFDVIIGNPPYGVSIKERERQKIEHTLGHCPDYEIYYYFIELAYILTKQNGLMSFIIPNTWLFNLNAAQYRISLNNKWILNRIVDCTKFKIFDGVAVNNSIVLFSKGKSNIVYYYPTEGIKDFQSLIAQQIKKILWNDLIIMNNNWGLVFKLKTEIILLIQKLSKLNKLNEYYKKEISQGLIAYDKYKGQEENIIKNRAYHSMTYKEGYKPFLWGEDCKRYNIKWNGKEYINYCNGIANPREPKFFIGKRLLIREITSPRIYASILTEEAYNDPALLIILDSCTYDLTVLLAILNSKLATFYHFNHSPKATKGSFPKILIDDLKQFPLPNIFIKTNELSENANLIKTLTETVLYKKAKDINSDTSLEEKQIDELVYKLYNLQDNEIQIIENFFKDNIREE